MTCNICDDVDTLPLLVTCTRKDYKALVGRAEKAEREVKALRSQVAKLDLAVRVALAFTRPMHADALHLLAVECVSTSADLTGYLRVALSGVKT